MLSLRQSTESTKVELYPEVILQKTIQVLTQYSLNKDLQHLKWTAAKIMDRYHLQIPRFRWTSSRRSIGLYPSKNGRCSQINKDSKVGVSRHLDSSTTTQMALIMVQYWRPGCSSWAKSVWSSLGRTVMGKAIWENPIETWMGENSKLGMSLCSSWKRIILICVCGWHKIGWKETKSWSDVESAQPRNWFGGTNIFLGSCILGLHPTTIRNKQRYCGHLQNHVWISNFRGRE